MKFQAVNDNVFLLVCDRGDALSGEVHPTLELFLIPTIAVLQRRKDEETGLPLLAIR